MECSLIPPFLRYTPEADKIQYLQALIAWYRDIPIHAASRKMAEAELNRLLNEEPEQPLAHAITDIEGWDDK